VADSDVLSTQKRGRRIALSKEELDAFLTESRTCRVATLTSSGAPHVSPLWYVWDGTSLWLYSIVKSQRWADILRDPRVAVVVDAVQLEEVVAGVDDDCHPRIAQDVGPALALHDRVEPERCAVPDVPER